MLKSDAELVTRWRTTRARLEAASPAEQRVVLAEACREARLTILDVIAGANLGHVGGDLSVVDILGVLYGAVLRIDPERPDWPERDRLVLSKGHAAVSLYTVLARTGFFAESELTTFAQPLSALNGHPDRGKVPGVETNCGPLGHGLPFAVGAAIAGLLAASNRRVFVILGDGELQEGSNWEAIMTAGHRRLSTLVAVVDRNRLQQGAGTETTNQLEPLDEKFRAFGWDVVVVDGHDHVALLQAFTAPAAAAPRCVIANTVKGRGVSFMEGRPEWHHKVPTADHVELARQELSG